MGAATDTDASVDLRTAARCTLSGGRPRMEKLPGVRVVHVVRQFHPSVGGLENFVGSLAKHQRQRGIDARVITLNRLFHNPRSILPRNDEINGVPVRRIRFFGSQRYPLAPSVLAELDGADVVHVHGVDFFVDFLAATKPFHRKTLVLSTHGGFFHTQFARDLKAIYFRLVTRRSLQAYECVFACSKNDQSLFQPVRSKRMVLIENGVDIDKHRSAASVVPTLSFVFVGRFSTNKRLDRLIEVFRALHDLESECRLVIVGRPGDLSDSDLACEIGARGASSFIEVHVGLDDEEVAEIFGRCSFFITASEYEGFGLALVEAASAGLIPIANRIQSADEIHRRLGIGLLVDFSDHSEAAKCISEFVKCASGHLRTDRATLIRRVESFGWPIRTRRFNAEYAALIRSRVHTVMGVRITTGCRASALSIVRAALNAGGPLNIAFANAHFLNVSFRDAAFRERLRRFLVLNDGVGVSIAFRLTGSPPPEENLNGTDLIPYLLQTIDTPLRIYLLGGRPDVVRAAERVARRRFPNHRFVGHHHGYLNDVDSGKLCAAIRRVRPDVVLVAMGSPLQEDWIANHAHETGATVHIAVGGLLDFISGAKPRAPRWIRALRSEWVFRLLLEPSRLWHRYLIGNFAFLVNVLRTRDG